MAKSLSSLRRVVAVDPPRFLAYGVPGIGKTSFAAEWPDPVFIQTERGTPGGAELISFGDIETFGDVLDSIGALLTEEHDRKTVVIDSVDALEPLIWRHVCDMPENRWANIETPGYGKGYKVADLPWQDFIGGVNALSHAGMAVVMIAHSEVERFESPTSDPYHRYAPKLHKRAEAMLQENSDIIGFFNYRVSIIKDKKEGGFNKNPPRAVGVGDRVVYLEERPGFMAKNRYQMPESVEYRPGKGYEAIAKYFPQPMGIGAVQQAAE